MSDLLPPPTSQKVSLTNLRDIVPDQYDNWVKWTLWVCLAGYLSVALVAGAQAGWPGVLLRTEPWAFLIFVGAAVLRARGRVVAAAYIALIVVTLEILVSAAFYRGMNSASLFVIPTLVVGAGLLVGTRAAYAFALFLAVAVPVTVQLSSIVWGRPPIAREQLFSVITLIATTAATAVFLHTFLVALARVLERARENERREREMALQLQHAQKLEAVGQLAGGVAHDFNNLLTVVAGYADFIADFNDPRAKEVANELRAANRRGVTLTRQLLAFARREHANPRPIDLVEALRNAEQLVARVLGEPVRLVLDFEEPCPITADPGQIEQIIVNLAANARDAMPDGGSFYVRARTQDETVVLQVQDSGVGISATDLQRVFEPFFTTKPRGKGTGLGLSTVHGIVTQTSGRIDVESRAGEGTTFVIRWPLQGEPTSRPGEVTPIPPLSRGSGVVLLAEDDEQARRLVEVALASAGYEVKSGESGAAALAIVQDLDHAPDMIISDVMMPEMSGVEFVDRARSCFPGVPVLFISGYTADILEPERIDEATELLRKPFTRDELLVQVAALLASSRSLAASRAV